MTQGALILDQHGQPMKAAAPQARLLAGQQSSVAYDAAQLRGPHMEGWNPYPGSPDLDLNPWRNVIVPRLRDLARNDGWASGIVTRVIDNALGSSFRPMFRPDWTALQQHTGLKTFDATWARDYRRAIKARFRCWADDPGHYNDSERRLTWSQQMRLAFRHKLIENDALAIAQWHADRVGLGRARYATALQLIDPDRLSNPQQRFDTQSQRGGVEVDDWGTPLGYHIRRAHPADWFSAQKALQWDFIPRETPWGRPVGIHDFDADRIGQHRGGAGILGAAAQRLKMLFRYDTAELDGAIVNAILGAYVESPFDHDNLAAALTDDSGLSSYQSERKAFHEDRRINLGNVRVAMLYPGEKINFAKSERPNSNFASFEKAVLRNAASAAGVSAQQASNDWSDVNYSSARAALQEFWKTITRRRDDFGAGFAHPTLIAWQEESHAIDDLPLPAGAPEFLECRGAYSRVRWLGPGIGWLDPVDEPTGAAIRLEANLTTYGRELEEQGMDEDEVMEERALELAEMKSLGLPLPDWAKSNSLRQAARGTANPQGEETN